MNPSETKLLIVIMAIGFSANLILGICGSFFPPNSYLQMILWQIGDSMAIMASVLASRYAGNRGQHIAADGFTLLGIAYGVSFASSAINSVNEEIMATIVLPLVPSLVLIAFCKLFPVWLRIGTIMVCVPFFFMYKNVIAGTYHFENISNTLSYTGIQLGGVLWCFYIYRDFRNMHVKLQNH